MLTLTAIAEKILARAKEIDAYLESRGLTSPSFDNDVLAYAPTKIQDLRASLANSSNDLKELTRGPVMSAMDIVFNVSSHLLLDADRL